MGVNLSKTNFFMISGTAADKEPMIIDNLKVEWCNRYVYLGFPFTSDGSVFSIIKAHAERKIKVIRKFIYFVKINNDLPFLVKKTCIWCMHYVILKTLVKKKQRNFLEVNRKKGRRWMMTHLPLQLRLYLIQR